MDDLSPPKKYFNKLKYNLPEQRHWQWQLKRPKEHVSFGSKWARAFQQATCLHADVELCEEAALGDNRRVSNEIYWVTPCQLRRQRTGRTTEEWRGMGHWLTGYNRSVRGKCHKVKCRCKVLHYIHTVDILSLKYCTRQRLKTPEVTNLPQYVQGVFWND